MLVVNGIISYLPEMCHLFYYKLSNSTHLLNSDRKHCQRINLAKIIFSSAHPSTSKIVSVHFAYKMPVLVSFS